jgi:hypothetical protein
MKLFVVTSKSLDLLTNQCFLPSVQDDFEIEFKQIPDFGPCFAGDDNFRRSLILRAQAVIDFLLENMGDIFLYSEVDIQFFKPVKEKLLKNLGDKDIVFQNNSLTDKHINSGFWMCRANKKILILWRFALKCMENDITYEEDAMNILLKDKLTKEMSKLISPEDYELVKTMKWDYLPSSFLVTQVAFQFTFIPHSTELIPKMQHWEPGTHLSIPKDIDVFHSNWTKGIDHKIALHEWVRNEVLKNQ